MKKIIVVLMGVLFLAGCGAAARESGYWEHSSVYRSWDHFIFSAEGYKQMNAKDAQLSKEQDWWGVTVVGPK
jgi:hypothetical protein